ncbi:hypothetical protein DOTSEDRAFT_50930 [Dothistroma septosporum NZE10]|uniref:Uncharacterized protein n=1 Tax=Dothistroma septosporum (strain NZE10 / CBS 128990) TaxID=675120 RepID=N1PVZ3_DOTSN|nr:hypothetical protein DOTSEDRAFT_50930 [Dothistroma septosporum NZE10]
MSIHLHRGISSIHPLSTQLERTTKWSLHVLPSPNTLSSTCDFSNGPDGALWGEANVKNNIFRVDTKTGAADEYPIPPPHPSATRLYKASMTTKFKIEQHSPARSEKAQMAISTPAMPPENPLGDLQPSNDLYTAEDGIWLTQTTGNVLLFFSFRTETIKIHPVVIPLALPLGLFVASDGVVFVAVLQAKKILTCHPKMAEKNGFVYFALFTGNGNGRIEMKRIPLYSGDSGQNDDRLARLDTKALKYSYVDFPNTDALIGLPGTLSPLPPYIDVAVNCGPGDAIYFTNVSGNRLGRYSLSGLY